MSSVVVIIIFIMISVHNYFLDAVYGSVSALIQIQITARLFRITPFIFGEHHNHHRIIIVQTT